MAEKKTQFDEAIKTLEKQAEAISAQQHGTKRTLELEQIQRQLDMLREKQRKSGPVFDIPAQSKRPFSDMIPSLPNALPAYQRMAGRKPPKAGEQDPTLPRVPGGKYPGVIPDKFLDILMKPYESLKTPDHTGIPLANAQYPSYMGASAQQDRGGSGGVVDADPYNKFMNQLAAMQDKRDAAYAEMLPQYTPEKPPEFAQQYLQGAAAVEDPVFRYNPRAGQSMANAYRSKGTFDSVSEGGIAGNKINDQLLKDMNAFDKDRYTNKMSVLDKYMTHSGTDFTNKRNYLGDMVRHNQALINAQNPVAGLGTRADAAKQRGDWDVDMAKISAQAEANRTSKTEMLRDVLDKDLTAANNRFENAYKNLQANPDSKSAQLEMQEAQRVVDDISYRRRMLEDEIRGMKF